MYFRIFDCWRLGAAMLVMIYHFMFFAPGPDAEAATSLLQRLMPLLDMFFMLSGFFIATRYHDAVSTPVSYGLFLRRRIARLYPLHLITLAFFLGVALLGHAGVVTFGDPARWDLTQLPLHLLAIHAWGTTDSLAFNYPSWSVSAEIFCYLLFPILAFLLRRIGLVGLVAFALSYLVLLEGLSQAGFFPSGHWTSANTFGAFRAFADFQWGAIAAILVQRRVLAVGSHATGLAVLGIAVLTMFAQGPVYVSLALVFCAVVLVGLSEAARPASTQRLAPLMPVTQVSFGIYLWHPVLEAIFFSFLWNRVIEPAGTLGFYTLLPVPIVATVVVALLSHKLVEGRLGRFFAGIERRDKKGLAQA